MRVAQQELQNVVIAIAACLSATALILLSPPRLHADDIAIGDDEAAVVRQFGEPRSRASMGRNSVWKYPTAEVYFASGQVSRIHRASPTNHVRPPPTEKEHPWSDPSLGLRCRLTPKARALSRGAWIYREPPQRRYTPQLGRSVRVHFDAEFENVGETALDILDPSGRHVIWTDRGSLLGGIGRG